MSNRFLWQPIWTATLTLIFLLQGSVAHAFGSWGGLALSGSQGTSAISTEPEPPHVNVYALHGTLGLKFLGFMLIGLRTSYSIIEQMSEPSAAIGNRRGSRFTPVSAMLGYDLRFARLQAEYQMSGDYVMGTTDLAGNRITYKKPAGFGVELIFNLKPGLGFGVRYEEVGFAQEQIGSAPATDLQSKLFLKNVGAVLDVHF